MTQWEVTPRTRLRKKVKLPKLWPTMPGHVLLVRCATKESATPVIAMRMVSQRVGCMNNPGVDNATSGLSQVDYGAENGAGKRWV